MSFYADNGSGTATEYFRLDGGNVQTIFTKEARFLDSVSAQFGSSGELRLFHTGTGGVIQNSTGDLTIQQDQNDGDIIFRSDDGSGGTAQYFRLDGGNEHVVYSKPTIFSDDVKLKFGDGIDLEIFHQNSSGNAFIQNYTGNLRIIQNTNDADITFESDNGSGSTTEYFRLDGSTEQNVVSKNMRFEDNVQAQFGAGTDLRIYHDGSDSYIDETGTGDLYIKAVDDIWMQSGANIMSRFNAQGVKLYYLNVSKLETISSGVKLPGPGDGITLVSPDGNTTRKISIDNSGNLVVA